MSVRERQHFRFGHRPQAEDLTTTIPMQQTSSGGDDEPLLLGFPAEFAEDDEDDDGPPAARSPVQLVVLRRADSVAGIALILAGFAAAASLWFPWIKREDFGLALVQRAVEDIGAGGQALVDSGSWPVLAVVGGGVVLLLLGVLLFRPARTHRLVGVLELFVAM